MTQTMTPDVPARWTQRLAELITAVALLLVLVVVVLGAVMAIVNNSYTAADYLEDLKTLVFGLAAVMIALELPRAVHRHLARRGD